MALTATGIGSGLDISNIVKVLVDAEKVPKEAIFNKTEDTITAKLSAIGTLKSALSTFQDALKKLQSGDVLNQRKVSTGESSYFTATASKFAQAGSYNIKVEQLAASHKVGGAHIADASVPVGEGSLDFAINGKSFSVAVDPADTIEAIAKKVNEASDNPGITATIITSDAGAQLVFSSDKSGTDNQIAITANDTSGTGLSDMFGGANLTELNPAANAILYVDNQKITSQSNEVTSAITGVTLSLTDADINKTSTLKIEQDTDAVKENVNGFVTAYNALVSSIDKLSSYDADKKKAAALQGDSMIRSLESQIRKMASGRVTTDDGSSVGLYDIGVKMDRYGKMSVDDAKLDTVLKDDMGSIESLFATPDTGLANRFADLTTSYSKAGGLIDTRKNAYTNDQQRLADQREAFTRKMEQLQARLSKQFNAMDLIVGQLNQQSSGLADRLNSLPGVVRNN